MGIMHSPSIWVNTSKLWLDNYVTESITQPFLTSALDAGKWSASCPSYFTFGEISSRRHGGHCRNETTLLSLPGIEPQPIAHPYTHYTTPAPLTIEREFVNLLANNFQEYK
jgi:hypothetical protein